MNKRIMLFALLWFCSSVIDTTAFDIDGFRSGMTRQELSIAAKNRGLEAKKGPFDNWIVGNFAESKGRIDGIFAFCGEVLVWYSRSIDFDVDYIPVLQSLIEKNGQPQRVRTSLTQMVGAEGNMQGVEMRWYVGNDRITLSFSPEGRDGKGQLRHSRDSSISYTAKNPCWKDF